MSIIECDGLLWVGDPHVTTRKPGRRNDENFFKTVLGKLEQAFDIANDKNLVVMILGDLLHNESELKPLLLVGLFNIFRTAKHKPFILTGNHDLGKETQLTDEKTMSVIEATGLVNLIKYTQGCAVFNIDNQLIGVGGTPYGGDIPTSASGYWPHDVDKVIWMTHEDMAFPGAYPGAKTFFEIKDCELVVNGHMHLAQERRVVGETTWFNPGNIIRLSVDTIDHKPSVWEYTPSRGLEQHILKYELDVFTQRVDATTGDTVISSFDDFLSNSEFVKQLKDDEDDQLKTDDGGVFLEDINTVLTKKSYSKEAEALTIWLFNQTSARKEA